MKLSARNQLRGTVASITRGPVTAMVKIDVGGQSITAMLISESVDELGLREGAEAYVVFKASAVVVGVDE